MTKAWWKDNKGVMNASGELIWCADCPCDVCELVYDDFERANGDPDTGSPGGWTQESGSWSISSGEITGSGQLISDTLHTAARGQALRAYIDGVTLSTVYRLIVNWASDGNYLWAEYERTATDETTVRVGKTVSGTPTTLATTTRKIIATDDQLCVTYDGAWIHSHSSETNVTASDNEAQSVTTKSGIGSGPFEDFYQGHHTLCNDCPSWQHFDDVIPYSVNRYNPPPTGLPEWSYNNPSSQVDMFYNPAYSATIGTTDYEWYRVIVFDLDIAQGTTLTDAFILFVSDGGVDSSGTLEVDIYAVDEDDVTSHTTNGYPTDVSASDWATDYDFTTASVSAWSVPDTSTVHVPFKTPDIKSVIQEVIDRPGWSAGNKIAIVFETQDVPLTGGPRSKRWEDDFTGPDFEPKLFLAF